MKAAGRLIVGSVAVDVYQRIENHFRKLAGASAQTGGSQIEGTKYLLEQTKNFVDKGAKAPADVAGPSATADTKTPAATAPAAAAPRPSPVPARDPWDALPTGSHVLAKYWESDGEPYGWWMAVVKDIDKGDYIVRWLDEPLKPAFKIERQHIALLHPSFDVTREWEKRRNR